MTHQNTPCGRSRMCLECLGPRRVRPIRLDRAVPPSRIVARSVDTDEGQCGALKVSVGGTNWSAWATDRAGWKRAYSVARRIIRAYDSADFPGGRS